MSSKNQQNSAFRILKSAFEERQRHDRIIETFQTIICGVLCIVACFFFWKWIFSL